MSDQIKFNRGLRSKIGNNGTNDVAFIADSSTNWDSIYLGSMLVGTSLLGLMKPSKLKYKATDGGNWADLTIASSGASTLSSAVITTDMVGTTPAATMTARKLVDYAGAGASGYAPGDNELLTAKAVKRIADAAASSVNIDTWYTSGTFDTSTWTWTASNSGGTGNPDLTFTLPVTTTFTSATDDAHIPTTEAVSEYIANLSGGMRYCGSLASTTLPASGATGYMGPYKAGDVFIASAAITISASNPTLKAEIGDMIVLKGDSTITTLSSTNCDVFERNLTGAVTTTDTLTSGKLIVGNGTETIRTLATTKGGLLYSSAANTVANLAIGTTGQHLVVNGTNDNRVPAWADTYYEKVAGVSGHANQFTVTPYTNGTAGSPTTITINDVAHATAADSATDATNATNVKQTLTSANEFRPILVTASSNPTSGNNAQVNYENGVTINASTKTLKATEVQVTDGTLTVNVFDTLTWHTLS